MPTRNGAKDGAGGGGGGGGDITAVIVTPGGLISGGAPTGDATITSKFDNNLTWTGVHTFNPGTSQATPLLLGMAQPGSAGQRDSHALQWRGASFDTVGHNADWREFVDVTSNAGASSFVLQNRVDAASFTTLFSVTDTGLVTVAGKITGLTQATASTDAVAGSRTVTAGAGLAGGGALTGDITINFACSDSTLTVNADDVVVNTAVIATRSYADSTAATAGAAAAAGKANSSVQIIAGQGHSGTTHDLTGNVTLDVGQGTGITVSASAVAVDQSFSPTWTGSHTFSKTVALSPGASSTTAAAAKVLSATLTGHSVSTNAEVTLLDWNMAATLTLGLSGTLALERLNWFQAPTLANGSGQVITTLVGNQFDAPQIGSNVTPTSTRILRVGSDIATIPTSTGFDYAAISVAAHTVTLSGTTAPTGTGSIASSMRLNPITVTDASAVALPIAATLHIVGPPIATGSVTFTQTDAINVEAGNVTYNSGLLTGTIRDTAAAAQLEVARFKHHSTTNGTAGIGTYTSLWASNAAQTDREIARLGGYMRVVTDTNESTGLLFQHLTGGAMGNAACIVSGTVVGNNGYGIGTLSATGVLTNLTTTAITSSMVSAVSNAAAQGGFQFSGTVNTSGARQFFVITPSANTGSTLSTEVKAFEYQAYTHQWATGALTTQREVVFNAPTYAFVGASTITDAATVAITGAPIVGTNATITNPWSLWTQDGIVRHDRIDASAATQLEVARFTHASSVSGTAGNGVYVSGWATNTTPALAEVGRMHFWLRTMVAGSENGIIVFQQNVNGTLTNVGHFANGGLYCPTGPSIGSISSTAVTTTLAQWTITGSMLQHASSAAAQGGHAFTGTTNTSGARSFFVITPSSNTNQTLSTAIKGFDYQTYSKQWATGAGPAEQVEFSIAAPTYSAVGASTFPIATTFAITGAPIAGTNMTITKPLAFHVQAGGAQFDGNVGFYGVAPVAQGTGGFTCTNSVTNSGSTDGTFPDITDGTVYANDYTNLRRTLFQHGKMVKIMWDQLRAMGPLT